MIVDATFRTAADRDAFSGELGGLPEPALVIECVAPQSVRLERARRRSRETSAPSDADAGVARRQASDGGLIEEIPPGQHMVLRTDRPILDVIDELTAVLDARIARDP